MSAAGRGAVRNEADFYVTPTWCVTRLLEAIDSILPNSGIWLDPCAGNGAIPRAVQRAGFQPNWVLRELREEEREGLMENAPGAVDVRIGDFLSTPQVTAAAVVLTNPPYSLAMEFVEACLPIAPVVAMLLRLNFMGAEKRANMMRENPPDIYVLPNRPSFKTGGGTDATEYAWFVWPHLRRRRAGSISVLRSTPSDERGV